MSDPRPRRRPTCAAALTALTCLAAGIATVRPAQAQDDPPGVRLLFDVAAGVLATDNNEGLEDPSGTTVLAFSDIALGLTSITPTDELILRGSFRAETGDYADRPDYNGGLADQFAEARYARRGRDGSLGVFATYRETDIGNGEEIFDGDDLVFSEGTRQVARAGLEVLAGQSAPISFAGDLSYADRRFVDATDPTLTDSIFLDGSASLSFRVSPTTSVDLSTEFFEREDDDDEDTLETNVFLGLGLRQQTSGGLTTSLTAGYEVSDVSRTVGGRRTTDTEERPVLRANVAQQRPDGVISASLGQRIRETGLQTDLSVGRTLDLRDGSFGARAGVAYAESSDDLSAIGSLDWTRDLPRGRLALRFDQRLATDEDSDFLQSTAGVSWTQSLTTLSSLSLEVDLAAREAIEADGLDRQRARASLVYSYRLTEDWNLNAGYSYLSSREIERIDGASETSTVTRNEVFATIGRRFNIRP